MKLQYFGFVLLLLAGCDGGGSGGVRHDAMLDGFDPPPSWTGSEGVLVSGIANKGPFARGSMIRMRKLAGNGDAITRYTSGALGEFSVPMVAGQAYMLEVTGRYFSESMGAMSGDPMSLAAIVVGGEGVGVNVNLATHLVHQRILALIDAGMTPEEAIETAETEMREAMRSVLGTPVFPMRFSHLAVLNGIQPDDNEEGNAWLLAMTSLMERMAERVAAVPGDGSHAELIALCQKIAEDFADDGQIDAALLQEMLAARAELNPDRIHLHLANFDAMRRVAEVAAAAGVTNDAATQFQCGAFGAQMLCGTAATMGFGSMHRVMDGLAGMAGGTRVMFALERMVANMNRFIDSDGDGEVNADDDDDDNDGIPDAEDDTPYGT